MVICNLKYFYNINAIERVVTIASNTLRTYIYIYIYIYYENGATTLQLVVHIIDEQNVCIDLHSSIDEWNLLIFVSN